MQEHLLGVLGFLITAMSGWSIIRYNIKAAAAKEAEKMEHMTQFYRNLSLMCIACEKLAACPMPRQYRPEHCTYPNKPSSVEDRD